MELGSKRDKTTTPAVQRANGDERFALYCECLFSRQSPRTNVCVQLKAFERI